MCFENTSLISLLIIIAGVLVITRLIILDILAIKKINNSFLKERIEKLEFRNEYLIENKKAPKRGK